MIDYYRQVFFVNINMLLPLSNMASAVRMIYIVLSVLFAQNQTMGCCQDRINHVERIIPRTAVNPPVNAAEMGKGLRFSYSLKGRK